jgi:hypothetical protein
MRKIKHKKVLTGILVLLVPLLIAHCQSNQLAGAGVETTNGRIAGVDTTDLMGRYSFTNIGSGSYNVVSVRIDDRTRSKANDALLVFK